jgi:hypothetical protein
MACAAQEVEVKMRKSVKGIVQVRAGQLTGRTHVPKRYKRMGKDDFQAPESKANRVRRCGRKRLAIPRLTFWDEGFVVALDL